MSRMGLLRYPRNDKGATLSMIKPNFHQFLNNYISKTLWFFKIRFSNPLISKHFVLNTMYYNIAPLVGVVTVPANLSIPLRICETHKLNSRRDAEYLS
jgi:hypothetical protein